MSELQRCRNILTDLHNRILELERGQVSASGASATAALNGTRSTTLASAAGSVAISNQSSVSQLVSHPATTVVSAGTLSNQYTAASQNEEDLPEGRNNWVR